MKLGDTITASIWLDGRETPAMRAEYEMQVADAMNELCNDKGFRHGPLRFEEKLPKSDPRVPEVPDHIQGPDVRLLIGEADIVGLVVIETGRAFIGDLDRLDLERLRHITRKSFVESNPGQILTDMECDDVIEELGPEAAYEAIRSAVDNHTVH